MPGSAGHFAVRKPNARIERGEKNHEKKTLGHIYALFTILVWGSCFVLTKVMLTAYTPTQIIPPADGACIPDPVGPAAQNHEAPLEG